VSKSWRSFQYILLSCLYWQLSCIQAAPENTELEVVILEVVLNSQAKGQYFFWINADAEIYSSAASLSELGLKPALWQQQPDKFPLAALAPHLHFSFDELEAKLKLEVETDFFQDQHLYLNKPQPAKHKYIKNQKLSLLFNYQINTSGSFKQGLQNIDMPSDMALRFGNSLLYSNFYAAYQTQGQAYFHRLLTQFSYDDPEKMYRLTIGDFIGNNGIIGGLSLQRKFNFKPQFRSYPHFDLAYRSNIAGMAALYIDNNFVQKWAIQPGQVLFNDIVQQAGSGEALLLFKDVLGKQQRIIRPFQISSGQLKAGLHDYHYQLGFRRQNLGKKDFDYGQAVFAGFHRLGISPNLTTGIRFDFSKERSNLDISSDFAIAERLQMNMGALLSRTQTQTGYGAYFNSGWQSKYISLSISGGVFDRNYNALSPDDTGKIRDQIRLGLSFFPGKRWGSLSLDYEQKHGYNDKANSQQWGLNYHNRLFYRLSIFISTRYLQQETQDQTALFVTLQYHWDKKPQLSYSFYQTNQKVQQQLKLSTPQSRGKKFSYDLRLQQSEQETAFSGRLYYRGENAEYSGSLRHGRTDNVFNLNLAGGIAWLPDEGIYFSRPIYDSFSLVKTGIAAIPVRLGGQISGSSNAEGNILVPGLNAWYENRLSISPADLAMNAQLQEPVKYVQMRPRSGVLVNFDIKHFQALEGLIFQADQALEYVPLQLLHNKQVIAESFIGKQGYFYLENIAAGMYQIRILSEDKPCSLTFELIPSDQVIINLGKLNCE